MHREGWNMNRFARQSPFLTTFALMFLAAAQAGPVAGACTDDSRECMIAAAASYLEGIVHHDGSRVPFAPEVIRTEQGKITGRGATELRSSQAKELDSMSYSNTRFFVDEKQHNVFYFTLLRISAADSLTAPGREPRPSTKPMTIHLAERIKVEHGLITEIEAIYSSEIGTSDGQSGWPASRSSQGK
jgi:hypothetical protein